MTEIERIPVPVEIVDGPTVHGERLLDEHEISSEWTTGSSQVMGGALRMARAAEHARVRGTLDSLTKELRVGKTWAYNLAAVWRKCGAQVLDGTFSTRLESSLSITHLVVALRADNLGQALDMAEDEGLTPSQLKARLDEDERPRNTEHVECVVCPRCNETYPLREALVVTAETE